MKWFKHDSCANRDAKLEKVILKYGAEGYALYWLCLELIADKIDQDHIEFDLEHDAETLGFRLKIDTLRVEEIMKFFVRLELFESDSGRITCLKLASRIENSIVKSIHLKGIQEKIRDNPGKSGIIRDNSGRSRTTRDNPGQLGTEQSRIEKNSTAERANTTQRSASVENDAQPARSLAQLDEVRKIVREACRSIGIVTAFRDSQIELIAERIETAGTGFVIYAAERAKRQAQKNPAGLFRSALLEYQDWIDEYLESRKAKPANVIETHPEPGPCSCGGHIRADLVEGRGLCTECGNWWAWSDWTDAWEIDADESHERAG